MQEFTIDYEFKSKVDNKYMCMFDMYKSSDPSYQFLPSDLYAIVC